MIARRQRLRRSFEKNWPLAWAFASGRLPAFVYGGTAVGLPVFVHHDVDAAFERELVALRAGGYRALGAAEVEECVATGRVPGRAVVLTFDDGLASLTELAVPLLESYGFRGIAFVVAGLVPERADGRLAGWVELCDAVRRGVLEVGSHSLFHHRVPVSPRVIGVVDGSTPLGFAANVPVPRHPGGAAPVHGAPILVGRPRYTARAAFRPDPDSVAAWIAAGGRGRIAGHFESRAEADAAVVADMQESLARIRSRCPNPAAEHLAYPWYAGDERTDALAWRAGVRVVYGGVDRRTCPAGPGRPHRLQRLDAEFLWRLPGPARRGLAEIGWWKLAGRGPWWRLAAAA